jgi:hypothetical protein
MPAAQGDMPKSGFSANSQAKVCANAVRGALTGSSGLPGGSPTPAGRSSTPMMA